MALTLTTQRAKKIMDKDARELRIFLSSTFRDMQAERDCLVKKVFPEIRAFCRSRRVEFTDIDLRWGLTREEAEQGKVVSICLEEIEKCRPYFLGFLGGRYGWSPKDSDLSCKKDLVERFPFVETSIRDRLSVTEMEIRHGVLDNPLMAEHSYFYFRSTALTNEFSKQPGASESDFFESDPSEITKLNSLKKRIRSEQFPLLDGYQTIDEFAAKVRSDLLAVVEKRFPLSELPSLADSERTAHAAYADSRCHSYIPDPVELERVDQWFGESIQSEHGSTPLVITGPSGCGKSSLLAYWSTQHKVWAKNETVISHYVGVYGDATPSQILGRVMGELRSEFGLSDTVPDTGESILNEFPTWLGKVQTNEKLVLIIDGLNQIDVEHLGWLPRFWPANIRLLVSLTSGPQLQEARHRGWTLIRLRPLGQQRRQELIQGYLKSYRKSLSQTQARILSRSPQSSNPLFLRILLEELRIFGSFEQLDDRLNSLLEAQNPSELYQKVLSRIEVEVGKNTVSGILSAIWGARKGLSENEIQSITGLSRLDISGLLTLFEYHLSRRGGLLYFFHDYLQQGVLHRYLKSKNSVRQLHLKIGKYFESKSVDNRVVTELPWQFYQAGENKKLKSCLMHENVFSELYEHARQDIIIYWRSIHASPAASYNSAVKKWMKSDLTLSRALKSTEQVAYFLANDCGEYRMASRIARWALRSVQDSRGEAILLSRAWETLGFALRCEGDFSRAQSAYENALKPYQDSRLKSNRDYADLLRGVGRLKRATGTQLKDAEKHYRCALKIYESIVGNNNQTIAGINSDLAGVLKAQGNSDSAINYYERAISYLEPLFGHSHPEVAEVLNAMGDLVEDRRPITPENIQKAEFYYGQALKIREERLGRNHPSSAACINNLGRVAQKLGKLELSERLSDEALRIRMRVLPKYHPDIATSLNQLARLKQEQGRYQDAEDFYRKAISVCKNSFGTNHRRTLRNMEELALLYRTQNQLSAAETLELKAQEIRTQAKLLQITI